jgi:hypothetical protein
VVDSALYVQPDAGRGEEAQLNCPNKKHKKPVKLKTERTIANGREVTRVRICPKCKERHETVELFSADWKATLEENNESLRELREAKYDAEYELDQVRLKLQGLLEFAKGKALGE